MIDTEARAGEWIYPIVLKQTADNKPQEEIDQIARVDRLGVKAKGHAGGIPVDDQTDKSKERDAGQLGKSKLRERTTVLRSEVGQVVGELVQPIDARTCAWKRLR